MIASALKPGSHHLDIADVERRVKAIVIGSVGNLVEWYDFYAYTAFALYFATAFFPTFDPVVQPLKRHGAGDCLAFKSAGHERWFYYYLSGMIFLSLLIYSTMRDTRRESAMHRHE